MYVSTYKNNLWRNMPQIEKEQGGIYEEYQREKREVRNDISVLYLLYSQKKPLESDLEAEEKPQQVSIHCSRHACSTHT